MKTEDFNFELPEALIAKYPLDKRDESRLLHYSLESKTIKHLNFKDIVNLLKEGDLLVRNNTKVLPARFFVAKHDAQAEKVKGDVIRNIEILLIRPIASSTSAGCLWEIMAKPLKKLKIGEQYELENGQLISIEEGEEGKKLVNFGDYNSFERAMEEVGTMPIPPYMKRQGDAEDRTRYQTIFAEDPGSVAAPTAGLHFTDEVFEALEKKGVEVIDLTLHVGPGTFLPIKADNIKDHQMQFERFSIAKDSWQKILDTKKDPKKSSRRIVTVGSTSTRCLEALGDFYAGGTSAHVKEESGVISGETDIFIYPGYEFKIVDGLLTNFHLPKSTLILMVSALMGFDEVHATYQEAIENKYRFYSYGDCMLIL